jgi:hypothetical protein
MVWLVVDCASRKQKQRQPDDNNSDATKRLLCCQHRDKDCNTALSSRHRQHKRRWWHCFCFCFCSYALWGRVVPSLQAADIGVMATSIAAVIFVGAIIPQAETKTAGWQWQQRKDACVASAGTTMAMQRQRGVAVTVRATLALLRNVCGASAAMMMATQLRNDDACVAGAAPIMATIPQFYGNATTLALLAPPTMATQRQRNRDACVASAARIMAKQWRRNERWSYAGQRHVETGGEEGGCKGGGAGGKGRIAVVVVVVDGDVDGNGGRLRPRTVTQLLLLGEDGNGDGS